MAKADDHGHRPTEAIGLRYPANRLTFIAARPGVWEN
jgi:hypothetical protein